MRQIVPIVKMVKKYNIKKQISCVVIAVLLDSDVKNIQCSGKPSGIINEPTHVSSDKDEI